MPAAPIALKRDVCGTLSPRQVVMRRALMLQCGHAFAVVTGFRHLPAPTQRTGSNAALTRELAS